MSNPIKEVLWNNTENLNGYSSNEQYHQHILEQYKLYVEMADKISSRRDTANAFFLTLNSLIFSAGAAIVEKGIIFQNKYLLLVPSLLLILQTFFWWRLINSYKQLNGAKFQIVGELETRLPASPYFKAEWKLMLREGKEYKTYWPLTHLESKIPVAFGIAYIIATVILFCSY